MSNIFCVTSTQSTGCTFIDWSIHWLSGADTFYSITSGVIKLTDSPLSNINAHGHKRNHPKGFAQTKDAVDHLTNTTYNGELSIYPVALKIDASAKELGIPITESHVFDANNMDSITDFSQQDFAKCWDYCHDNNVKIIFVSPSSTNPVYFLTGRSLDRQLLNEKPYASIDDFMQDYLNIFFKESLTVWEDSYGLRNKWDLREFLALNLRPYNQLTQNEYIDFTQQHLYIDSQEIWHDGERTMVDIMQYLGINLDKTRLPQWEDQYRIWQAMQTKILKFSWNYEYICDCIVKNFYYNLSSYNLTLQQEALIQHILIFKHGLNLKSWGLEKFPNNTQDLHLLLEPNRAHKVEDIYNIKGKQ
jgi:hypothetical protein